MSQVAPNILHIRAESLKAIRDYFYQQRVLEVDTPLLSEYSVTDPYMSAMQTHNHCGNPLGYLQTSPEYAMKKLLCHGSGDIYQLGKVFRADETSPNHNNEFTMLEWYRTGFDEYQLMDEVFRIITLIIGARARQTLSYRAVFDQYLGIDPFTISYGSLATTATKLLGELPREMLFDNFLTLLFAEKIEPQFDPSSITFITDFPASQASLAQIHQTPYGEVARRFEAYSGGLELANGFYELGDAASQLSRFKADNQIRATLGYPQITIDSDLIRALQKGLPACAGVALGVDRLLMLKIGATAIQQVLPMSMAK